MNCQRVQQLVSPYLDHRLTGAEMLEMQRHLEHCGSCAAEYQAALEIKVLLRSLSSREPVGSLEARIAQRLDQEERPGAWIISALPALIVSPPAAPVRLPQRGRRLAAALALSCVGLFTIAAPFAPTTADIAAQRPPAPSPLGQPVAWQEAPVGARFGAPAVLSASLASSAAPAFAPRTVSVRTLGTATYRQAPLVEVGAEPLGDDTANGYVALADFQTP